MSDNEPAENNKNYISASEEEHPKQELERLDELKQRKDELKRGRNLIGIFAFLLVILGVIYVYLHYEKPAGLLSPRIAWLAVKEANNVLTPPDLDKVDDPLDAEAVERLTRLSARLRLLEPQLGAGAEYSTTISQIVSELGNKIASRSVLIPLFKLLEDFIQIGSGSYFWTGSLDRWIELAFWAFFGNLVFLMNEIKNEMETYFPQIRKKKEGFIKPTPWYVVYFFRGPFIALVILVALSSISFEVIGVSLDLKTAPIEVSIVLSAILGYYSRVAAAQLEIIATKLLGAAWNKVYKDSATGKAT